MDCENKHGVVRYSRKLIKHGAEMEMKECRNLYLVKNTDYEKKWSENFPPQMYHSLEEEPAWNWYIIC